MTESSLPEESIFAQALDVPAGERSAFLDRACAGDPRLRAEVDSLLQADARTGDLLDLPERTAPMADGPPEAPGTVIGPYKLLESIGEGGFGVVYLAEQQRPVSRKVALKVLKPGMDTRQVVARFEAERQALALMDHPNIARIHDGGTTLSGRPYFVMELVRGVPITQFCDQSRLPVRERLTLFVQVCQAVQHAHQKGIIHRDLKPSNVMVTLHDGKPVPKVIDFGVAKALGQKLTDKTLFTGFAQMVGTPVYMSPEQAELSGLDVDTRSDVYALGVLLYELLTGTTPFDGERLRTVGYDEMRRIIREEDPARPSSRVSTLGQAASTMSVNRGSDPRRLTRLLRGELDWVVMKCLEKDRARRYETADALAKDLERYLSDEPVQAFPPSVAYRARKFVQRNKGSVIAAALVLLALTAGVGGTVWEALAAIRERDDKFHALKRERQFAYFRQVALAHRELEANRVGRADQLLDECPEDLRGWEWHYLKRLRAGGLAPLGVGGGPVGDVALNDDGSLVAAGGGDRIVKLWDTSTGRRVYSLEGHTDIVACVAFSPDGRYLASGSSVQLPLLPRLGEVKVWDVRSGENVRTIRGHGGPVYKLAFSHNGRLASASSDGTVKIWDAHTGWEILALDECSTSTPGVTFSPDGRHLATIGIDRTLKVWDSETGRLVHTLVGHRDETTGLAFSPDGRRLASTGFDSTIRLWDISTEQEVFPKPLIHPSPTLGVAFSPDGQRIASAGWDKTVRLWDATTGQEILTLRDHTSFVLAVAFSGDSLRLASVDDEGTVRVWDARPMGPRLPQEVFTLPQGDHVCAMAYSPDGRTLAAVGPYAKVTVWDASTGHILHILTGHTGLVWGVSYSPNGKQIATASYDRTVIVWNAATGEPIRTLPHKDHVWCVEYSPDGKRLASGCDDGSVTVWDVASGSELLTMRRAEAYPIASLAFSPNGERVVSGGVDRKVHVWDAKTGRELPISPLSGHRDQVRGLAYSPDGKFIASACYDQTIKVWYAESGKEFGTLEGHKERVFGVAFSPDSRFLASASVDASVKVWDITTQEPIRTFRGHCGMVWCVAFSPDGKQLAVGSGHYDKGEVRIWDATGLEELAAEKRAASGK
ncbi:MAG TPA: protein kinase [Gemmataceae bacterium]|nr:protein kinase [Gemmataceae bacterium]